MSPDTPPPGLRLTLNGEERALGPIGTTVCVVLAIPALALVLVACLLTIVATIAVIPAFVIAWAATRGR